MNYKNLTLEKGMYCNPNKSFSQILEELDPSENYSGSNLENLDAFQRQLKRFDIKVNGPNSDFVSKFFETNNSRVLFPEFLARSITDGISKNNILKSIVVTQNKIDSLNYHNIEIDSNNEANSKLEVVDEGQKISEINLKINENSIKLKKFARLFNTSYEMLQFQKIDPFKIALNRIGHCLGTALTAEAIDVLIKGDNNNPAEVLQTTATNKISYNDLINVWTKFEDFEMNTILAHPAIVVKIAEIEELKNPISKLNFPISGTTTTPLGATIVRTNVAPKDSLIFLDRNFALNQIIAKDITVESDKLIDKQISRTVIYTINGFSKICKNACCVLKLKSA